ncbi:YqhR family membrane protein [Thalassobacillus sp. CUG 92003]|uniref:YqhR family membrane protein n=1 Tax=Thalassobacillus sp. CUG 92003 TaxID=2736641 RepID=UPI001C63A91E|nr:YqhR family membrane protein [Thalassobacillus sp. CUG 92003]
MNVSKRKHDQRKQEPQKSVVSKAVTTGFVSGVLWSGIGAFTYFFHFSEVSPASFFIRSFWQNEWTSTWIAEVLGVLAVALISMVTALVYYLALKKLHGMWPGIVYGILIWLLIFLAFNPIFNAVPAWGELSSDTMVTTFCLHVLYGVFIGYSISYEYHDFNQSAK